MTTEKPKRVYVGVFLDESSREKLLQQAPPRHPEIHAGHVTLAFGRHMEENYPVGTIIELESYGQCWDDRGQCLVIYSTEELHKYLWHAQTPHITISCATGIRPIYSNELMTKYPLDLVKWDSPLKLKGVLDYFPRTVK